MQALRQRLHEYAEVLVVIGGLAQGLLKHLPYFFKQLVTVLVIDVHEELRKIPVDDLSVKVKLFTLGRGQTAVSLVQGAGPEVRKYLQRVGGMGARDGCGQGPAIGDAAGLELINSADFVRFLEDELVPDARTGAGGVLSNVDITTLGSGNGGTWSGASIPVVHAVAKAFRNLGSAVTSSNFVMTGPLTHDRLGPRIRQNAAASLARTTAYVTDLNRDEHEIRTLRVLELPSTGRDERLRQEFLASLLQASRSEWLLYELQREAPNHAVTSFLGNVQMWEVAYGKPLDLATEIAPPIARAYGEKLKAVRDSQPDQRELPQLELSHEPTPLATLSIDEILQDADNCPVDVSLERLCSPSFQHEVEIVVKFNELNEVAFIDLLAGWLTPATTLAEFQKRHWHKRHLVAQLSEDVERLEEERGDLERERDEEKTRFRKIQGLLHPIGFDYVRAAISNKRSKRRRRTQSAQSIRYLTDELAAVEADLFTVLHGLEQLQRAWSLHHEQLDKLIDRLNHISRKATSQWSLVSPRPLDDCFPLLWEAAGKSDATALLETVGVCVEHVTVDGLARITGSNLPTLDAIARRIAHGACYEQPPIPWGGKVRSDSGWLVHVIPPIDAHVASLLRAELQNFDQHLHLAECSSCVAGVNVVGLVMRHAHSLKDDLFPPTVQHALVNALKTDCHPIVFADGIEPLTQLGISFDGDSLHFTK